MTEDQVSAYDAAAATLLAALQQAHPEVTWRVPNSYDALMQEWLREAVHAGRLEVIAKRDNVVAQMSVTVELANEAAALPHIADAIVYRLDNPRGSDAYKITT